MSVPAAIAGFRRKPRVRRIYLGPAEREELAHSGFLQRPDGTFEVVLYFDDGRSDYAATVPPRLARRLRIFLEQAMDAIEPLMVEDVNGRVAAPARRA